MTIDTLFLSVGTVVTHGGLISALLWDRSITGPYFLRIFWVWLSGAPERLDLKESTGIEPISSNEPLMRAVTLLFLATEKLF